MKFKTVGEVYRYLHSIPKFESEGKGAANFELERFRSFCTNMDNPQNQWAAVHIGGTNGKGSTARLIASIYQRAGYSVGLYTSPHLISYKERFSVNGNEIPDQELLLFFNNFYKSIQQFGLTYFEISTAVAFWWFARKQVTLGIIEVGLGGRLDATNIITPAASVITSISLDHTDLLGTTVEEIASEKAGIIKPKIPVVTGHLQPAALQIIQERAREKKAPAYSIAELKPKYRDGKYGIKEHGEHQWLELDFQAPVQLYNIATARMVTRILAKDFHVGFDQFKQGIEQSSHMNPNWGHFEKLHPALNWYFDGAHNEHALSALQRMVQEKQPLAKTTLIFAIMKDKLTANVVRKLSTFGSIYYYQLETNRAASFKEVKQKIPAIEQFPSLKPDQNKCLKEFESELVIFTGSFYFYSTVREWIARFTLNR